MGFKPQGNLLSASALGHWPAFANAVEKPHSASAEIPANTFERAYLAEGLLVAFQTEATEWD